MPSLPVHPVEAALDVLGVSPATLRARERIKHGLTNESWLIRTARDALVVRISAADEQALQIDRRSEASILAAVSAAGIGPEVVLCDPDRRLLVTRYIPGETWRSGQVREPENLRRLAALVHALHGLAVPAGARRLDLAASVQAYWRTLDARGERGDDTAALRRRAQEVLAELARGAVACLCHNDLNPLNILDDGRLWLIDWEYAGVGEPLFDLASICAEHRLGPREREALRMAYAQGQVDPQRLELACWLFEYVRDLWMAVRATPA